MKKEAKENNAGKDAVRIIKEIMETENVKQKELAERIGCTRQNISQALNKGAVSMRYDSFWKMVYALGYEIIVRKK